MSSLREIKDRIASVRSTLKITSAMKLVAASELRKAQKSMEAMSLFRAELGRALGAVMSSTRDIMLPGPPADPSPTVAVIAVSSNNSLCGAFNVNAVKAALAEIARHDSVEVFPVGRKMAEALRKTRFSFDSDLSGLIARPSYADSAAFSDMVSERFREGRYGKVVLVHNSFVSPTVQRPVVEDFLPLSIPGARGREDFALPEDIIVEPSHSEVVAGLLPLLTRVILHTALLDSAAAEHAARTMAMQMASDNAEKLLSELVLDYNKGRQQKITAEILDLVGGAAE